MHICCIYIRAYLTGEIVNENSKYKISGSEIPLGISYISSSLKQAGYTTELIYCTEYIFNDGIHNYFEKNPKIFAISITSVKDYVLALKLVLALKEKFKETKIIVGGPYITLHHKNVFEEMKEIDAMCIGSGDKANVEYVRQVEKGKYKKTDNLWIKDNDGQIIKCDKILSTENLDELPYPDRKGWKRWIRKDKCLLILWTTGCIYSCIFCENNALRKISSNRYFNKRSVESFVKEVNYIVKEFKHISRLRIVSENALGDIDNFRRLCIALKKINNGFEKKISFLLKFNFTSNLLDKDSDILLLMKGANIKWCAFSLESGSQEIRKKLGKPTYTNEQIIEFFKRLRSLDINTFCFVMYCYPFETKNTYNETVECLRKCKPTQIICSLMKTLEYTELIELFGDIKHEDISFIHKYRYNTLLLRVYITYKPIIKTLLNFFKLINELIIDIIKNIYITPIHDNLEKKRQVFQKKAKEEMDKGNFKRAIKYFNKVKIKEDNCWIYGDRGIAKMNIGDYKGAIKDFDKVLELEPKEIYKEKREECLEKMNKK